MRRFALAVLCVAIATALSQTSSPKYQPGTVIAVDRHVDTPSDSDSDRKAARYDVSVRIDDTVYVVLYTPLHGSNAVEFSVGLERVFLIGKDSLTYSESLDRNTELPILHITNLPPQPAIVWSKAPGQYFSMKMKNLTTELSLSDNQQAKIKPIAEQESAEAGSVMFTPTVSRKERLSKWEKIVKLSDGKMKVILSEDQWQRLQAIRKDQKRELMELIAKKDGDDRK